jgi:hypothetical protein
MKCCSFPRNVGGLERLACLALGAGLLLKGVVSRRTAPTVLGGLFVYRGLSGHCCGYAALGMDTRPAGEKTEG